MKKYALLAAVIFIASSAGIAAAYFGNMGGMGTMDRPDFESVVEHLNQLVADEKITQEQADEKIEWMEERMEERQENCTGDGNGGKGMRIRFMK